MEAPTFRGLVEPRSHGLYAVAKELKEVLQNFMGSGKAFIAMCRTLNILGDDILKIMEKY